MSLRRSSGTLKPQFNPFKEDYLAELFSAVVIAWASMIPPKRNEIEDRITFRLAGRLANDPQFEDSPYDIVAQYWLLGLRGQRLGRLDLRIKHRYSQRDYFAFEAKRLHVTYPGGKLSTEYATYSGEDGMMAFLKGQYCKGLPCAGMLGYIMDNESTRAWTGLKNRIDSKRRRLRLSKGSQLEESKLSYCVSKGKQGTLLGETAHGLKSHRLRLFHLLLPV
ncbi:MAG TPA: hypothetical protein VGK36_23530 [Candidatus Angelobacter sp.]|jgi:hypothetical protein